VVRRTIHSARLAALLLTAAALTIADSTRAAPPVARAMPATMTGGGTPGEVAIGQPLRDASMQGLNGPTKRLSEFRGRPLIINVWASWCGPCRAEMASIERLAWSEHGAGLRVIGISTDDYADRAQAWLRQSNATISHYIDRQLQLENMLGASRLPLTVFVSADGRVLARVYGAKEWDGPAARRFIEQTFSGRAPAK
jgi:thiol-disulfide isomerase/thioredoxin